MHFCSKGTLSTPINLILKLKLVSEENVLLCDIHLVWIIVTVFKYWISK